MDTISGAFLAWRRRASDQLHSVCGKSADDVWQGDWLFNWHQSWVAGCTPFEAAQDAYCELRDRGLLSQELEPTPSNDAEDRYNRR